MNQERKRLKQQLQGNENWRLWGPYLSERAWGTVREDYSEHGTAWEYFDHEQARSRAYRWNEDGLGGISDEQQLLCFSLALWNGKDPILKERAFGLTGNQGNRGEDVKEIMQQSDGKLIVAGTAYVGTDGYSPGHYFGLTRLNSDGTLDTAFGLGGSAIMSEGIYFSYVTGAAVQSDDKIVVVGYGRLNDDPDASGTLLSRFNANGTPDTSFGTNGSLYLNLSPAESYYDDTGDGVTVQEDGKILVVGRTQVKGCGDDPDGIYHKGLLLRFNSDGTLDSSFDGDGIVKFTAASVFDVKPWDLSETYPCEASVFDSVAVQADGKIVVMGQGWNSPYKMFVARFNTNGSLDTTFGIQGVRALYHSSHYDNFDHLNTVFTPYLPGRHFSFSDLGSAKMILNKDGGITVSGSVYYDGDYYHYDFLALHFTKNGNFDKAYGLDGDASVNVNFPDDFLYGGANANALAEQSNGQIILAGYADGYDAPATAILTRTVLVPKVPVPAILYLLMN